MTRSIILYVQDILDAVILIENYTKNTDKISFEQDVKTQDAVIHRIEIIGEASKHILDSFREKYSDVPWKALAGIRDILIHAYLDVQMDRIWKISQEEVPLLKKSILAVLSREQKESSQ